MHLDLIIFVNFFASFGSVLEMQSSVKFGSMEFLTYVGIVRRVWLNLDC